MGEASEGGDKDPWEFAPTTWPEGPFDYSEDPEGAFAAELLGKLVQQIQARMDAKGKKVRALARDAGLARETVSRLLKGVGDPKWQTISNVMRALQLNDFSVFPDEKYR